MGLFSDIKAIKEVQRIKNGGIAKLSIAQITGLITNMSDAQKNLSPQQFKNVYDLYKEFRKCNSKIDMDIETYNKTAVNIIKTFDKVAPYEKYSGGNEIEISLLLMNEIRSSEAKNTEDLLNLDMYCNPKDVEKDIDNIINSSAMGITREEAKAILAVCMCNQLYGKDVALNVFDKLANKIISENSKMDSIVKISFLAGVLYPNGVVGKAESDELGRKYTDSIIQSLKKR